MARGTTFLALQDMLKDELGLSTNVGIGIDGMSQIKRHINRGYALVYDAYDWPHLRTVADRFTLNAGQRLYDFPADVSFERTQSIAVYNGAIAYEIAKGITSREYTIFDSESNVRSDPAQKWDIRWSGTAPQIEIWPIPDSSGQTCEVVGLPPFVRLVDDDDVCLLDDDLVVLAASIRPLARQDSKDGEVAKAEFQSRMAQMRARAAPGSRVTMGGAGDSSKSNRVHVTIAGR